MIGTKFFLFFFVIFWYHSDPWQIVRTYRNGRLPQSDVATILTGTIDFSKCYANILCNILESFQTPRTNLQGSATHWDYVHYSDYSIPFCTSDATIIWHHVLIDLTIKQRWIIAAIWLRFISMFIVISLTHKDPGESMKSQ